ncbi:MAG: alpha-galactosidase, partial [Bacteroidota bacterium]
VFAAPANETGLALRYHVQLQEKQPLALLWMEVVNATAQPVKVERLEVLRTVAPGAVSFGSPGGNPRIFTDNGGLMGSGSHDLLQKGAEHVAHGALVVTDPAAAWAASASFVSFQTGTVTNAVKIGDNVLPERFAATCSYPNGYLVQPGASLKSEVLAVGIYDEPHEALERWADTVMAVNELQPPKFCPSGWNSWYCYRLTISEDIVLENARFIKEHWDGLGLENIQIDHGWQDRDLVGNWVANKRFPHGLPWLSEQLKAMGFSLGLWTAVTNVSEFAPLYSEHPEALIQGADGKPLVTGEKWFWEPHGKTFSLDPTSPAGLAHFRKVGEDLKSYGCTYNKNDFQGDLLTTAGQLYDKTLTRGAPVYRMGMGAFAEAKGPQMAYHACNAPLNIVAGLADVAWVHGDIGNPGGRWDWLRGFVRDFSCRYHVSGKFYWSDPDYLQVKESTVEEARVRAVICALGGGPAFLSDRLPEVPAERLALIPKCLPSYKRCATPVDLFERDDYPRLWDLPVETTWGAWHVLGLFNLDERAGSVTVNLAEVGLQAGKEYLVWDFFGEKLLGEVRGLDEVALQMKVPMPATDARVLKVAEKQSQPFVLSTDMHLTQGGVELPEVKWDQMSLTLSGVATRAKGMSGKVFVYVPEGYEATGQAGRLSHRVLILPLEFAEKRAAWKVEFTRG